MTARRFEILDCDQRSIEWRRARCGRLTGSAASAMLAKIKSGEAAARRDLRLQLACERLTGEPQEDGYTNDVMRRGIELEPAARAAYEAETGLLVSETGFLAHHAILAGCSLDGHIDDFVGIVELKCPKSATHLRYLQAGVVPPEYLPQVRHNLWISGADWCDFVSFDPRFPDDLRLFIARVNRSDAQIEDYEREAVAFLVEVDQAVEQVRKLRSA